MNSFQLNRVLSLLRRGGGRCLLADNETDEVFALLPLTDYEDLLNGGAQLERKEKITEKEFGKNADDDFAFWRANRAGDILGKEDKIPPQDSEVGGDIEDIFARQSADAPAEAAEIAEDIEEKAEAKEEKEAVPFFSGTSEEELLTDIPEEDRDTFLLEPI
jgi:hypothetical protein